MQVRCFGIISFGALALGGALSWFFSNFCYELVWAYLASHHVRQSLVIAYALAHLTPFILSVAIVATIYIVLRHEFRSLEGEAAVSTDLNVTRIPATSIDVDDPLDANRLDHLVSVADDKAQGFRWRRLLSVFGAAVLLLGISLASWYLVPTAIGPAVSVIIDPPTVIKRNQDGTDRIFVERSPDEIRDNFDGHTTAQADSLVAPYLSKWLAFTGIISDIIPVTSTNYIMIVFGSGHQLMAGKMLVYAFFDEKKWHDRISILRRGDTINSACRILEILQTSLKVDQCELF